MTGPDVTPKGQRETAEQQKVDLLEDLLLRNSTRRNGPVGLVDGVEVLCGTYTIARDRVGGVEAVRSS